MVGSTVYALLLWAALGFTPGAPHSERQLQKSDATAEAPDEGNQDEDLAPAAVELDPSSMSPLTKLLYQATRETKQGAILDRLSSAKKLIADGTDLKSLDAQGRTPLHWAVFGSSYSSKPKTLVAYEEIADALLTAGVDVNREDAYHDTVLDYLLYSPNFEMQTLLLEHGANSGSLLGSVPDQSQPSAASDSPRHLATLTPGQTIDVRLLSSVYSDRSRTGDPIEGVVTYPLCVSGEFVACKEGELLLTPGTRVSGTVLFARKAPDKYSRPLLVLDFSNVLHRGGRKSLLYARVLSVDNARETVRNNEILGIIQPHAETKASITLAAVATVNPIAGYTMKAVQIAYGLSLRRETAFPAGSDLQLQVIRPSSLRQQEAWAGWPELKVDAPLQKIVTAAPARTQTAGGTPSDITNLLFLGSKEQLETAFGEAGWFQPDDLSLRSAARTLQATIRQSGYSTAPVSGLRINNRLPDLVFQKSLNTFARRHHLRIWKRTALYNGREVWIAAATHDIAISNAKAKTKWSHRIDPHIDRERDWVATDLLFIGTAKAYTEIDRPNVSRKAFNATGDQLLTDGKIGLVDLGKATPQTALNQ